MTMDELLVELGARDLQLRSNGRDLILRGDHEALEPALISALRAHKNALLGLIGSEGDTWWTPPVTITPEMLPLVRLTSEEIARIVATVPGGAANVQDIYPLAALQEGILFHHLMGGEGDAYLRPSMYAFDSRARLEGFIHALQAVIDRHDILRTAMLWEGLPEPVQVVWRDAALPVEDVGLNAGPEDATKQLYARFDPQHYRMDVRQAPMLRVAIARDEKEGRWLLLLLRHHLVSDHSTLEVMHEEVEAHLLGKEDRLPRPLPFRNLVAQARLGVSQEEHEAYFRKLLSDVEEPTAPFGLLDVQGDGSEIEEARSRVDDEVARKIREQARRLGVSAASLCHVAWAQVLGNVSGREDVVFGSVLFGRMQGGEGADRVMGLFINTLPVRIGVGEEGVEGSVRGAHKQLAELLRHEHASLALAQRCSGVPAPRPLFSALLNYRHSSSADQTRLEERRRAWQGIKGLYGKEWSNYPVTLSVDDMGAGFGLVAQTLSAIGPMRICEYMHTALASLVEALENSPATPMRRLNVLGAAEREQLLYGWNRTKREFASERCAHELFEQWVAKSPNALAIAFEEKKFSYGELNRRANRLAHYLRQLGVGPDERVAICLERGLERIVAALAVWKAGGAYVPLDPAYPVERLSYMVKDSAPSLLLTEGPMAERFEGVDHKLKMIDLVAEADRWKDHPTANPDCTGLRPENLAYVIYTSGSTGLPKGAMLHHRGLCNLAATQAAAFSIGPESRALQFASFGFDASVFEMVMALCHGASLYVMGKEEVLAGEALEKAVADNRITHAILPPAALAGLPETVMLETLQTLMIGGDAVSEALVRRWSDGRKLINAYGPTEVTVWATTYECDGGKRSAPPIGRAVANARVYVLNEQGEPAPVGVTGEIYVGGAGVGRGYLNRAELTAERFVPDPYIEDTKDSGARMYRTGDLGRWRADGQVEFLGRNDFQVKVRGFRIELGEIEARLAEHAGVQDAVVLMREETAGDKRLVAYYTCQEEGNNREAITAEELRASLASNLPEYMVPAAYVQLEKLPLTANGKLDRKALPAPDEEAYAKQQYEEPQGEMERKLAEIWAEVLKLERVGRHDNFFSLGGHSLLAVTLIERMRRIGLKVDVRELFAAPTLATLAAAVDSSAPIVQVPANKIPENCEAITPEMLPLVRLTTEEIERIVATVPGGGTNVQDIYPLAPLQEGILFHHLMVGNGDPYLGGTLYSFDDRARLNRYISALQAVIERHDILRTAVLWEGLPEPVQVVWRKAALPVEEVELKPGAEDAARRLYERFHPRHFRIDVRQAPLLRLYVSRDEEKNRWLLLLLRHHLVIDHSTLEVMQSEIVVHMLGQADRLPTPLPFRNLVAQARLGVSQEEHEAYFRKLLSDVEEPTAPFGLLDVQGDGRGIEEARSRVDDDVARKIREQARRLGVSAASLCHVAWAQVLGKVSGREDVVFGSVLFGRMQGGEGADRVMGLFINTLPVRIGVGEEGVEGSVRGAHKQLAELLRHEHASLALAQRCSGVPAPRPLFSSLLNYRHSSSADQSRLAERKLAWEGVKGIRGEERSNYPITLSVDDFGAQFWLKTQVEDTVEPSRVCRYMHTALASLVEALENAPATPVRTLNALPAPEREQLLYGWNQTKTESPSEKCVHELFEEQAERAPNAVAVLYEDRELTYGELNRRANQLAHYLRELGVGPDERVAICLDRGPEMVVGLLGILKAGGVYVPLDPAYPVERLSYMLEDASPLALLTEERLRPLFSNWEQRIVMIDLTRSAVVPWRNQPESNLNPRNLGLSARHLAYVIYTSGSTGQAKGVAVEHRNVCRLVRNTNYVVFRPEMTIGQVANVAFDASTFEIWGALANGSRLAVISRMGILDTEGFARQLRGYGVSTVFLTTALFQECVRSGRKVFTGVKEVLFGGEVCDPECVRAARAEGWPEKLVHVYGPTETTTFATFYGVEEVEEGRSVSIGSGISNTRVYVLDARLEPVPVGVAGEIYIGGMGVARGYLKRAELTAERFVPDPYIEDEKESGARMYRTGDLGRWRRDGQVEFLGRNDFQVKVRGFRIELGEIEARLAEHAGIRDAIVLMREDTAGDKRLVAYYTKNGNQEAISAEELRAHLAGSLPEYMVPAAYIQFESLSLTANGKVDRRALPAPDEEAYATREYEAPQGEIERKLSEIWAAVLKLERVGRRDDFFALGGNSLLTLRMANLVEQAGMKISVPDVFRHSTVESLASRIKSGNALAEENEAILVRKGNGEPPLFLTPEGTGTLFYNDALAPYVDANIPIYGLPAKPTAEAQLQTMEGMAARMVRMIRAVQPEGPYRLGGWSYGGILAYEIAAQLIGANERVDFLALLDTRPPSNNDDDTPEIYSRAFDARERLLGVVQRAVNNKEELQVRLDALRSGSAAMSFEVLVEKCRELSLMPGQFKDSTATQIRDWLVRIHAHGSAYFEYSPQPIPVPVHLLRAQQEGGMDARLGWDAFIPDHLLKVITVPGTHHTMMESPNVEQVGQALSQAIRNASTDTAASASDHSAIVVLQPGRPAEEEPLFCVPGAGNSATSFVDLTMCLGTRRPVYGFQPRGLDGTQVPYSSVSTAAETYVRSIEEIYPKGRLHLLGHSFGGWIAFEMAQRLLQAGRQLAPPVLLDSKAPYKASSAILEFSRIELIMEWLDLLEQNAGHSFHFRRSDFESRSETQQLGFLRDLLVKEGVISNALGSDVLRGPLRVFAASRRTYYQPMRPYPGPIQLVLADDPMLDEAANRLEHESTAEEWKQWAPNLVCLRAFGNHMTMLKEPHVQGLVRMLGFTPQAYGMAGT